MTRRAALDLSLYVVTDSNLSLGRSHEEVATQAIAGGADALQYRDKDASDKQRHHTALKLQALASRAGVLFIVNDSVDIALTADTDGVHLGQDDLPADAARRLLGPHRVLGVSVEDPEQAEKAARDGADYVAIGPIYPASLAKSDAGIEIGPEPIAELRRHTRLPIVAIGGIKHHHVADVIRAGADGIAVISAIVSAPDIAQAAREMKRLIREAKGLG